MSLVRKIAAGTVGALALFIGGTLGIAATRPATLRVERSQTINAEPAKIFALLNDFHAWNKWSPWEKMDPGMSRTHSGAATGVGAKYSWKGNRDVGSGSMEITESTSPSRVSLKLDFIEPFEGHNTVDLNVVPNGDSCKVTWTMQGPQALIPRAFGLFMNMDAMIGKDFEAGLSNLKALAETP
jgi:carbon monoxide dehydrogenase subunit G